MDKSHHKAIRMLYESSFTRKEITDELKMENLALILVTGMLKLVTKITVSCFTLFQKGVDYVEITKKHQMAIALMFEGDLKRSEVANQLKVTERTLYNWLKDKDFSQAYDDYVKITLSKSTGKALNTMIALLGAKSEMVKFNAAKDILDRGGIMPDVTESDNITINIVNDTLVIGEEE